MKIIVAQFKKDVASARALFWSWLACVGVTTLVGLARLSLRPDVHEKTLSGGMVLSMVGVISGAMMLVLAQFVLLVTLAIRVVHADSPVDPNAFWRTRPIARGELLGEKALFIVLLAVGMAISLVEMGMQTGGQGTLGSILTFGTFLAGLFALAALTPNLTKLVLHYLGFAWGSQVAAGLIWKAIASLQPLGAPPFHGWVSPTLISALHLTGFAAVIVWQYLTLRTNVSRWILGATFFLPAVLEVR